jgi:hypothetical protein
MFFPVLRHLNFQKPTSQQGEKKNPNKQENFGTVYNNMNIQLVLV